MGSSSPFRALDQHGGKHSSVHPALDRSLALHLTLPSSLHLPATMATPLACLARSPAALSVNKRSKGEHATDLNAVSFGFGSPAASVNVVAHRYLQHWPSCAPRRWCPGSPGARGLLASPCMPSRSQRPMLRLWRRPRRRLQASSVSASCRHCFWPARAGPKPACSQRCASPSAWTLPSWRRLALRLWAPAPIAPACCESPTPSMCHCRSQP